MHLFVANTDKVTEYMNMNIGEQQNLTVIGWYQIVRFTVCA